MKQLYCRFCKSRYDRYVFLMLLALEVLMSFTFLGYIHIPPISITYAFIPILAAGVLLGPLSATATGMVFGLCSMYKASAYYVMSGDRLFSPFMSGMPLESLMLSVGTRTLFGLAVGLMLYGAKKSRHAPVLMGIIAVLSRKLHSLIVYAVMGIFFPEQGVNWLGELVKLPDASDIVLDLFALLIVETVWWIHCSEKVRRVRNYIDLGWNALRKGAHERRQSRCFFAVFAAVTLCACFASAVYFARRTSYMMVAHNMALDGSVQYDLLHLQMQFLMAMLALSAILWLSFMNVYQYMTYQAYMGKMDGLTGAMGRGMFRSYCDRMTKEHMASGQKGCFLMVDVDYFKSINDTLGHPTGDTVLRAVAECLKSSFEGSGEVGRMGGDEFAVFMDKAVRREDMERVLDEFMERIADILADRQKITCSVGCWYFTSPASLERIYEETDGLVYEAKRRGRAQYVIGGDAC